MHNRCGICNEFTDMMKRGNPMCGICQIQTRKLDMLIQKNIDLCEKVESEQEALLAVTREAAGYVDGEQAAYYSGTPTECIGFASRGCQCGPCMAREYRSNHRY
jgi:hypothetical protein